MDSFQDKNLIFDYLINDIGFFIHSCCSYSKKIGIGKKNYNPIISVKPHLH